MKTLSLLMAFLALCATAVAETDFVTTTVDDAGDPTVWFQVDLLGLREYQVRDWAKTAPGPLKVLTYPLDYAAWMAQEHPFQTAAIVFLGLEISSTTTITPLGEWFGTRSDDGEKTAHEQLAQDAASETAPAAPTQQTESGDNFNIQFYDVQTGDNSPIYVELTLTPPAGRAF